MVFPSISVKSKGEKPSFRFYIRKHQLEAMRSNVAFGKESRTNEKEAGSSRISDVKCKYWATTERARTGPIPDHHESEVAYFRSVSSE